MADNATSGLGDLFGLFGGANPLSGITKSISQFQQGVADFLVAIEHFNATMEQFNIIAARVNGYLDIVEEPIKAVAKLPNDLAGLRDVVTDLTHALQPLGQVAESAGSLFGFLPKLGSAPRAANPPPPPPPPPATRTPAPRSPAPRTAANRAAKAPAPAKKAATRAAPRPK